VQANKNRGAAGVDQFSRSSPASPHQVSSSQREKAVRKPKVIRAQETQILGGDSSNKIFSPKRTRCQISVLFPQSRIFLGPPRCRVRQDGDSTVDLRIKLCLFSYYCYFVFCVDFFIFPAFTALACILVYVAMHHFKSTHLKI
jgi:hypothetical protein